MKFKEQQIMYYKQISSVEVEIIQQIVADYFGITTEMMQSKNRDRFLCDIRFVAIKLTKENLPSIPLKGIGYLFGYRDHTTVINALNKVDIAIREIGQKRYLELELKVKEGLKKVV